MGPPAGSRPKGKEKEKPKIRNLRRYRIGGGFGTSSRQLAKRKREGKPKIRNLRRYRIGGGFGTSSRQPAKRKREGKAENQKFEAVYNRRVPGDLQPAAGQKEKRRKSRKSEI